MFKADLYKNLLLKTVNCTGYLKNTKPHFSLYKNNGDGNWYYKKDFDADNFYGIATIDQESWKHNCLFTLVEKEFQGVVVKIFELKISELVGIKKDYDQHPVHKPGFMIPAAEVYYQNGKKHIVPIDCIIEADDFTNGLQTKEICENIAMVSDYPMDKNTVQINQNSTIELTNSYFYLDPNSTSPASRFRSFTFDVKSRSVIYSGPLNNFYFDISEKDYNLIISTMKSQMKEICGFEPTVVYGETKLDRLINFAQFPFAPELNQFSYLFDQIRPCVTVYDINSLIYKNASDYKSFLQNDSEGIKHFIELCGMNYSPKLNKLFIKGHRDFENYLGIWQAGFRNEQIIQQICEADTEHLFGNDIRKHCEIGYMKYDDTEEYSEKPVLFYRTQPLLTESFHFLFSFYNEKAVAKFVIALLKEMNRKDDPIVADGLSIIQELIYLNATTPELLHKIEKEGITVYNHNLLLQTLWSSDSEEKENQSISYSQQERTLEWEKSEYSFKLPEDTDRLSDIGNVMNICVGNVYRDKALEKESTIVYVTKNEKYCMCIEVQPQTDGTFKLIQKSAFNNKAPSGKDLDFFKSWCLAKKIK